MLTITDVVPAPEVGQYWASLQPLYLFQVRFVDVEVCWQNSVATWIVVGIPESAGVYLGCDLFLKSRLLRESRVVDPEELGFPEALRTGDVITFKGGELAFVVVDGTTVTLYSDWVISKDPAILTHLRLFQRGPVNHNLEPTTRLERVLGEDTCP